jgi:hypothetical protein
MSLLINGAKAMDVLETALNIGLLDALEPGPAGLRELAARFELRPLRLYKFLDCLESLGFIQRDEPSDDTMRPRTAPSPGSWPPRPRSSDRTRSSATETGTRGGGCTAGWRKVSAAKSA